MKTECTMCGVVDYKVAIQAETSTNKGNVIVSVTLCPHCHHATVAVDTFDYPTIDRRNEYHHIDVFGPKKEE